MVLVKVTEDGEAGVMPPTELLAAVGNFDADLVDVGLLQAGRGLTPSAQRKACGRRR